MRALDRFFILSFALFLVLVLPPIRGWLEASLSGHMLVQIPLIIVAGGLWGHVLLSRDLSWFDTFNRHGIPGLLLALFTLSFWMLPRSLDAALAKSTMEVAKFASLPLLVGVPLALSWPKLPAVAKGFVLANLLAMLSVLGWLYTTAPVRLCNYYLINDQAEAGRALLAVTAVFGLFWLAQALFGKPWRFES